MSITEIPFELRKKIFGHLKDKNDPESYYNLARSCRSYMDIGFNTCSDLWGSFKLESLVLTWEHLDRIREKSWRLKNGVFELTEPKYSSQPSGQMRARSLYRVRSFYCDTSNYRARSLYRANRPYNRIEFRQRRHASVYTGVEKSHQKAWAAEISKAMKILNDTGLVLDSIVHLYLSCDMCHAELIQVLSQAKNVMFLYLRDFDLFEVGDKPARLNRTLKRLTLHKQMLNTSIRREHDEFLLSLMETIPMNELHLQLDLTWDKSKITTEYWKSTDGSLPDEKQLSGNPSYNILSYLMVGLCFRRQQSTLKKILCSGQNFILMREYVKRNGFGVETVEHEPIVYCPFCERSIIAQVFPDYQSAVPVDDLIICRRRSGLFRVDNEIRFCGRSPKEAYQYKDEVLDSSTDEEEMDVDDYYYDPNEDYAYDYDGLYDYY